MPTSSEIRQQFIDYFVDKHAHTFVPSSPVVPHDDPTLLFANAGMNQFKDVFLGTGGRPYSRAVNSQKCIRAGGKHNDLEDVGRDTYHHTFFEMLGNWSFGDYFKKEAIDAAWDLLVNVWGLPKDRLYATVFEGDEADGVPADEEAESMWKQYLPAERISRWGKKDNFWEMGDTGPCGPCSEIHIDISEAGDCGHLVNRDDPRVIEIWNLVFIQFNRAPGGALSSLPNKHVDTGMGLERVCAVIQGKSSNYDTDLWTPLFDAIREVSGARPYGGDLNDPVDTAYRILADHIRTLTFAITDGSMPSNEGRGYVLRRILRRAVRHGRQTFGIGEPFLCKLVDRVVEHMGGAFPELKENTERVAGVLREEEELFGRTLDRGIALFEDACGSAQNSQIAGDSAFELYATYGFPLDLTQVMAEERGMTVDIAGFESAMEAHKDISRGAGSDADARASLGMIVQRGSLPATEFTGYDGVEVTGDSALHVFKIAGHEYAPTEAVEQGDHAALVVDRTPFYAEAGGQVGDVGFIETPNGGVFEVDDTVRVGDVWFHLGKVEAGEFVASNGSEKQPITLRVDTSRRAAIMANHTATHIMNHKMRAVLGEHVQQRGSLVDEQKTRFDLSHDHAITVDELDQIEQMVNHDIAADLPVYADYAKQEDALKINGLRAVFGEKYPPTVRVVSIGVPPDELLKEPDNANWPNYSIEFCGGTHLPKTGDAEGFVFVAEEAVSKGVRRVTAQTGKTAHKTQAMGDRLLARAEALKQQSGDDLAKGLHDLQQEVDSQTLPIVAKANLRDAVAELQQVVKAQEKEAAKAAAGNVVETARAIADAQSGAVIVAAVDGADGKTLRDAMDVIKKKHPESALLLGAVTGDKCAFLAAVPKPMIGQGLKAGDWVKAVAQAAGGGGGGRPDMAQAGGKDASKFDEALDVGRAFAAARV